MHRSFITAAFFVALSIGGAAGCGNDDEVTPPPTTPGPIEITEPTFIGTLTINGGVATPFSVTAGGTVTAIIDSLAPDPTVAIGVALGVWNGTSCQMVVVNDLAGVGSGIAGFASQAGSLCARVFDVGRLTQPTTFAITIKHY